MSNLAPDLSSVSHADCSTVEGSITFQQVLDYENEHNLQDYTEPEEEIHALLSEEDVLYFQRYGDKLPPIAPGRQITPSMINFAKSVVKAYRICFSQFVQFINNSSDLMLDSFGYCTRNNVDTFFEVVIARRTTSAAVNRRYVSALQKYNDYWEERPGFIVDSPRVKKALEIAKVTKQLHHQQSNKHVDAHKHRPTLHHTLEQENEMINEAFLCNTISRGNENIGYLLLGVNFLISWNCSMQGFTRGDEVRGCRFPDLCHEVCYGPFRMNDTNSRADIHNCSPHGIISMIQQPLCTKIRSSRSHAVGFFRHKDWKRCATSIISFSVMARFSTMTNSQLDEFFAYGNNNFPNWYSCYLIDWRDWDSMSDVFRKFFDSVQVKYTKLTHTRKLGIIRAHQMGADRENIILLSKHTVQKVDTSYLPELPYSAMLAAAGFDVYRREEYYIPQSYIQVPDEWIQLIFPWITRWQHQVLNLHDFDKGDAAKVFVFDLLPFMATVILQDGVHLINEYPDHLHTKILLNKMQGYGYIEWAEEARCAITNRQIVHCRQVAENNQYEAVMRANEHVQNQNTTIMHEICNLRNSIHELRRIIVNQSNVNITNNSITRYNTVGEFQQVLTHNTPLCVTPALREHIVPQNNHQVEEELGIIPVIPPRLHNTIMENMEHWLSQQLWTYDDRHDTSRAKLGWTQELQQRYSRRKNLAMWVRITAEQQSTCVIDWDRDHQTLLEVAKVMDEERGQTTVVNALKQFLNESPYSWRKKRKRKRKNGGSLTHVTGVIVTPGNDSITSQNSTTDNLQIQAIRYKENTDKCTESTDSEEITMGQLRLSFSEDSDDIPLSQLPQLEQLRQTRKLM